MSAALRVAVIGSGPSGLYAATELLKREPRAEVDIYDRLPTPGGLARAGVSPDHAARRAVIGVYERLAIASGRCRFHGNVEIGRELSVAELLAHHHAVIYASGAASDKRLGIAGEDLAGSVAATEFVGWYNAHPDHAQRRFDLSHERAVVVGNGNVALDVARMLLLPIDELRRTDTADHALEALAQSRVREVVIVGRRGPAQASFTAPELLELNALHDVDIVIEGDDGELAWSGGQVLRTKVLRELQARGTHSRPRRLVLRFQRSPLEIIGDTQVRGIRLARNTLTRDAHGEVRAQASDQIETLDCGLVLRSVGYRALPFAGLPFDEARAVLPNAQGRVLDAVGGAPLPGVYVAGWLKRGPSGVIGSNKLCSTATVQALLADANAGRLPVPAASREALDALLAQRQPQRVDYRAWKAIDRNECSRGAAQNRPRVRYTRIDEMLAVGR